MARSNIRILAVPAVEKDVNKEKGKGKGKKKVTKNIFTKNIVYKKGSNSIKEVMHHMLIHIF